MKQAYSYVLTTNDRRICDSRATYSSKCQCETQAQSDARKLTSAGLTTDYRIVAFPCFNDGHPMYHNGRPCDC